MAQLKPHGEKLTMFCCFRQKKEHEEKLAREEEDRQRNKEIWERVKRELQEDEQEAAKNWKDTKVCAMLA